MMKSFLIVAVLSLSQCVLLAEAADKNMSFNVIHTPKYGYKHSLLNHSSNNKMGIRFKDNDEVYILDNKGSLDSIIYKGTIPSIASNASYQYVIVDKKLNILEKEPFYRPLSTSKNEVRPTYDFYGRLFYKLKSQSLPSVKFKYPNAQKDYQYKFDDKRQQVHPNDEIPTWHLHIDEKDMKTLHNRILDDGIGVAANITRIDTDKIKQFNDVQVELSGQTSRLFKKLSFSVRMGNSSFHGYQRFKIRSCAADPSYLREKLYYDILNSMNVPTAMSSFIRLFINNEPQGLYLIADNYKLPFFKNLFGQKHKSGALIQGSMQENPLAVGKLQAGANLAYLGPKQSDYEENGKSAYAVHESAVGRNGFNDLISFLQFIKDQSNHQKKDEPKIIQEWNKRFDVSLFLKHLSLELLLGHGDGYMGAAHNYLLYQDLEQQGRFIWLSSDLDQTMGSTLKASEGQAKGFDQYGVFDHLSERPLVREILKIEQFQKQFQQTLLDVRQTLVKNDAINHYILYLKKLIEQDVHWDEQLEPFRSDNFKNNRTVYNKVLNDKVLQLPLGHDFINRINQHAIDFDTAIQGTIEKHPSITSLFSWFEKLKN